MGSSKRSAMKVRRMAVATGVVVAGVMTVASLAYACSVYVSWSTSTQAAPAGSQIEAQVANDPFPTGAREVRWDALDGPVVSSPGLEGDTLEVTVPDVAPGVYSLVFAAGDAGVGRLAFEVLPSPGSGVAAASVSPSLWSGFSSAEGAPATSPTPVSSSSGMALGLGLVALGLLAVSGLTVAELRRSRQWVTA